MGLCPASAALAEGNWGEPRCPLLPGVLSTNPGASQSRREGRDAVPRQTGTGTAGGQRLGREGKRCQPSSRPQPAEGASGLIRRWQHSPGKLQKPHQRSVCKIPGGSGKQKWKGETTHVPTHLNCIAKKPVKDQNCRRCCASRGP